MTEAALGDRGAEGRSVGVVEIVQRDMDVEAVAESFRAAVNGVVFGSGDGFEVMRIVALQSGDKGDAKPRGEEGILAVGFLAAPPARIAEDVDVGRPESETEVATGIVVEDGVVVFGAGLGGDNVGDAMKEVAVPGGGEADGLWEDRGNSGASDSMEALVPPVVGGDIEARDGGGDVLHLGDFFFEGEAGDQVVDALVDGE